MSKSKWIQHAIKRPGSLRRWLEKHRKEIERRLGEDPFTRDGEIKLTVLRKLKEDDELLKELAGPHWKRVKRKIVLAITLKRMTRHKHKGRSR